MNLPFRLIAVLPMLMLVVALIATACESAAQTPDDASQNNAIAAAAPTETPEATVPPEHTQTPTSTTIVQTATPDPLNPPTPQPCPPGEIAVPITVRDGIVYIQNQPCFRLTTPTPLAYPKLDEGLNQVVDALESGASIQDAASLAESSTEGHVIVIIEIDRNPRELVEWIYNNGAEFGFVNSTFLADDGWAARNETTIDAEYGIILLCLCRM